MFSYVNTHLSSTENFLMAASAIVAASTSFNVQHPSLTQTRHQTLPSKPNKRALSFSKKKEDKIDLEKLQRSQTMNRKIDIDSTPRALRKLDRPYLDTFNRQVIFLLSGSKAIWYYSPYNCIYICVCFVSYVNVQECMN